MKSLLFWFKVITGCILVIIGIIYSVEVYIELVSKKESHLTAKTADAVRIIDRSMYSGEGYKAQIAVSNDHHLLFGMSAIAGAILLSTAKVE